MRVRWRSILFASVGEERYIHLMSSKIHLFLCLMFIAPLAACIPPQVENRGYVDALGRTKQIVVGTTTRDDVRQLLGTPSLTNNFGEESWYYISKKKEAVAFLKPEITDQHVTRIAFDQSGLVTKVEAKTLKDAQGVEVAKEVTPTEGQQLGFVEQMLGNVGRFNAADSINRTHSTVNSPGGRL